MDNLKTCDMHLHTSISDGELSVADFVKYAHNKHLEKMSITDHDSVDAYYDDSLRKFEGEILTGCEFICLAEGQPIEILGYGLDISKTKAYFDIYGFGQDKLDRSHCDMMIKALNKNGFEINFDYDAQENFRPLNMRHRLLYNILLQDKNIVNFLNSQDNTFTKGFSYLLRKGLNNPDSQLYVSGDAPFPSAKVICNKIHEFGGLAFLAHPYQYGNQMHGILNSLKNILDGVECYHYTSDTKEKQELLKNFCKTNALLVSGGSDFHRPNDITHRKDKLNELNVPAEYFDIIKSTIRSRNLDNIKI